MKSFSVIAAISATQAINLSYDNAGGLLGEPEFMRAHPEWKISNLLSSESQKQRPDVYLGIHQDVNIGVRFVGGNSQFELSHLLSPEAEKQKQRPEIYTQTGADLRFDGNSEILKSHPEWSQATLLSKENEF
mgnify:CR=1 FL=1